LKTFSLNQLACQGENTVAYAKRLNFPQRVTALAVVQENIAPLRATRGRPFILTENGLDQNEWQNERNRPRDQRIPCVLTEGVVSSTGFVSNDVSSMFSRMD
jgi:hypothetical protein